jgi:hypothetical protein
VFLFCVGRDDSFRLSFLIFSMENLLLESQPILHSKEKNQASETKITAHITYHIMKCKTNENIDYMPKKIRKERDL